MEIEEDFFPVMASDSPQANDTITIEEEAALPSTPSMNDSSVVIEETPPSAGPSTSIETSPVEEENDEDYVMASDSPQANDSVIIEENLIVASTSPVKEVQVIFKNKF